MEEEFEDDGWMGRHRPGDEEVNAYNHPKFAHHITGFGIRIILFVYILNLGRGSRRANGEPAGSAQRVPDQICNTRLYHGARNFHTIEAVRSCCGVNVVQRDIVVYVYCALRLGLRSITYF